MSLVQFFFGGTGAYIGGPSSFMSHKFAPTSPSSSTSSSAYCPILRSTRSSLSPSLVLRIQISPATADQSKTWIVRSYEFPVNAYIGQSLDLLLFSEIKQKTSRWSEGEVSRTRVVCRSAPGEVGMVLLRVSGGKDDEAKERWGRTDNNARKKEERGLLQQAEGDVGIKGR